MEEDKIKKILIILIFVVVVIIFFVVIPLFVNENGGTSINYTTDEMFKNIASEKVDENTSNQNNGEDVKNKELSEIDISSENSNEPPINRDLKDPFYTKIREKLKKQQSMSEIYIPKDYIPSDSYIKNAASNNGKVHVFKKQPILIYVPRTEYYDAITQAFVTYNNTFKGLISFNTVKNPDKAQIKIILTEDFGNNTDISNAIGLGRPLRYDNDGNIVYSEVSIKTKDKSTNQKMPLVVVYNTMLHELGHALGIMGHSQDARDVMYKEMSQKYHNELMSFSDRDIETFKILYSGRKNLIDYALQGVKEEKLDENIKYAQESNDADSYLKVASSYYEMGEYSKALEAYKKALSLNPDNYRIYLGLSHCYEKAKQYEYAITYAQYALQRAITNEQKADCNHQIGIIYFEQDKYMDAYPYLNMALILDESNPAHFINYLIVCGTLDRKDMAKDTYNKYIGNYDISQFTEEEKQVINWAKN